MVARPKSPCGALLPKFYAGRAIFITGSTGFMGKVLIERLLSTCPDVGTLYLLMRPKKGVMPEKRLLQLKQSPVFDILRQSCPSQLEKLCMVPGDVCLPGFGLEPEHLKQLQPVSVVFHSAATVKFDEALPAAVEQNVLSVLHLMDVCDSLPKLEALVHVSTAYSNPERSTVEERVYSAPAQLPRLLALIDALPPPLLEQVTARYIDPKPNTYTFTKAMAEEALITRTKRHYSVAIFRPTIVISSYEHPFPGWIENLNGPSGVVAAASKGLLHVFRRDPRVRADLLPVDIAIDTLLAVAWETALDRFPEARVYNCSTYENPTTWLAFERALKHYVLLFPPDNVLWYPFGAGISNKYTHKALEFLLQTLPLNIAEYMMRALGIKMQLSLSLADKKLRAMGDVLAFFSTREWHFKTTNVEKLRARLTASDAAIYNLDPKSIDWNKQYKHFILGTRKYLLKEKDESMPGAKKHLNRMYYVHKGVVLFAVILLFRLALQNKYVRDLVYGTLRLMLSLVHTTYYKIVNTK